MFLQSSQEWASEDRLPPPREEPFANRAGVSRKPEASTSVKTETASFFGIVLDVGCGFMPYRKLNYSFGNRRSEYLCGFSEVVTLRRHNTSSFWDADDIDTLDTYDGKICGIRAVKPSVPLSLNPENHPPRGASPSSAKLPAKSVVSRRSALFGHAGISKTRHSISGSNIGISATFSDTIPHSRLLPSGTQDHRAQPEIAGARSGGTGRITRHSFVRTRGCSKSQGADQQVETGRVCPSVVWSWQGVAPSWQVLPPGRFE